MSDLAVDQLLEFYTEAARLRHLARKREEARRGSNHTYKTSYTQIADALGIVQSTISAELSIASQRRYGLPGLKALNDQLKREAATFALPSSSPPPAAAPSSHLPDQPP